VDEDFILDRFNLTGLNSEVANYPQALDLITDSLGQHFRCWTGGKTTDVKTDEDIQDELRGSLDVQARLLYGLIHARWIVTARGLQKMVCLPSMYLAHKHPAHHRTMHQSSPSQIARQVQACRLRTVPSRTLRLSSSSPSRRHRHPVREVSQTLLRPLRGPLLAQVVSPWIH
jgi:hypothetical protein